MESFFLPVSFEEDLFESVVIHFTRDEVLIIEEMLKELHESRNTGSFAYEQTGRRPYGKRDLYGDAGRKGYPYRL